jgi:hypothetical protein
MIVDIDFLFVCVCLVPPVHGGEGGVIRGGPDAVVDVSGDGGVSGVSGGRAIDSVERVIAHGGGGGAVIQMLLLLLLLLLSRHLQLLLLLLLLLLVVLLLLLLEVVPALLGRLVVVLVHLVLDVVAVGRVAGRDGRHLGRECHR